MPAGLLIVIMIIIGFCRSVSRLLDFCPLWHMPSGLLTGRLVSTVVTVMHISLVNYYYALSNCVGAFQGRFQAILLVFGYRTCPRLPIKLPGTSQLKCFAWRLLVEAATSIQGQAV